MTTTGNETGAGLQSAGPLRHGLDAAPRGESARHAGFLLLAVCLWGLAAAALLVDLPVARWCGQTRIPGDFRGMLATGERFGHGTGAAFVLLTAFALESNRRVLLRMACCVYLPGITANLLKTMVVRTRPIVMDLAGESGVTGFIGSIEAGAMSGYAIQSFPSGHTATAVGLAVALAWRYPRGRWVFFLLAALTGLQRIQCQAHFVSDVLAGAGLGLIVGCLLTRSNGGLFDRFEAAGSRWL